MKHDSNVHRAHTAKEIGDWIRRYRASGVGLVAFANQHELSPGRLHYWVYAKRYAQLGKPVAAGPAFQELKFAADLPWPTWAVEVSLPAGPVARFSATATPAWIGSVVEALRRPC